MKQLILVTGGSRSGKSRYAQDMAESMNGELCFIATAEGGDGEMIARIEAHRQMRDATRWLTAEEPLDVCSVVRAHQLCGCFLMDCATLWVSNIMFAAEQKGELFAEEQMRTKVDQLVQAYHEHRGSLIVVTNEVGMGIVPENALARRYRDLVGTCNQLLAFHADRVILVSCGIPVTLKQ